jgi:hypothetical protein
MCRPALAFALAVACLPVADAADLPIFDAHVHYSHDAWANLPPAQAIDVLRQAGVRRALVSSSGDEGTQRLAAAAPDLILPSLRPYRSRADVGTWVRDDTVIPFLEDRLARHRYVALGEFHVFGADADLPVMRRTVELARKHGLLLHLHGDADAVERVLRQDPAARILWAHSGFAEPATVRAMLARHANLWCDLAFRTDFAADGRVRPEWRALFEAYPDRFMVGTDTYTPERWLYVGEHAKWAREWLRDLPPALAERIAWRNGEALFARVLRSTL